MTNILEIQGTFLMSFYHLDDTPVGEQLSVNITDKLREGIYLLGLNSKTVCHIDDLQTPLFKVELDVTSDTEYDFYSE